jgi:sugar phosphate isomerase/epimerase
MLERAIIQQRGFRNVIEDGQVTGVELQLRMPNYRGNAASLIDGVDVVIDGETWDSKVATWTLGGRTYTLDELRESTDLRWPLDEVATVTVPKPGGLAAGVHDITVIIYLRRPYMPAFMERSPFRSSATATIVPDASDDNIKYGVSLYSYSGDMYTSMTLEDAMADISDLGATGLEILGEGNIPGYPEPTSAWIDDWYALLAKYELTPTNYGSWIDTSMWRDRDLTAQEGAGLLQRDMRLANRLGFTSIRPKFGVITDDLQPHPIWTEVVERSLDLAEELGLVISPEIHSPTPIKHPVTQEYIRFIERTGTKYFKLLIDTGIFQTAPVDEPHEGVEVKKGEARPAFLEPLRVPMADLTEVLPHVHFIQAKFFEIDSDLHDLHVPWNDILATLRDGGWSGFLSSEYEGRREPYRGRDQVRRQHALLRSLAKNA